MRHPLLLALTLMLTLAAGCKKEDDSNPSLPYMPPYRVSGVVDFSLQKLSSLTASYSMAVAVEYENGEQERVTLSLEGVPAGLKDSIRTSAGYPSFNTTISFIDSGVADGTYTLKLIAQGEKGGRREYPFTVRVLPVPACAAVILGSYTGSAVCVGGGAYGITVQASPSVSNRIIISNFNNGGQQLYADVICDGGGSGSNHISLNIPSQTVNGISYSGDGFYSLPNINGNTSIALYIVQSNMGHCSYYFNR